MSSVLEAAAALLLVLALAGCGGSSGSQSATTASLVAPRTTPSPTRDCGSLVGGASEITAKNVDCRSARLVARIGRPIGWACVTSGGRVACRRGIQVVRFTPSS